MLPSFLRTSGLVGATLIISLAPIASSSGQIVVVRGYAACPGIWSDGAGNTTRAECRLKARSEFVRHLQPPKAPSGTKSFTINPISRRTTTSRSLWFHPALQIRVINTNPYLYEYKVDVASEPVTEPAVYLFFKALLPGLPSPKDFNETVMSLKLTEHLAGFIEASPAEGKRELGTCSPPERTRVHALLESGSTLAGALSDVQESLRTLTQLEALIVERRSTFTNPSAESEPVIDAALGTIDALSDFAEGAPLVVEADAALTPRLTGWIKSARVEFKCGDDSADLASLVGTLSFRAKTVSDRIARIDVTAIADDTRKEAQFLAAPLREPTSFFKESVLDGGSATVKVTVQRRAIATEPTEESKKPAFATVMSASTGVGIPRIFSLAVGMTSFTDSLHTYQPTKVYSGNLQGADSVTSVITELATERRKVAPLFLLDARLPLLDGFRSTFWSGIGLQIGATVAKDVTTNVEYVAGISSHFFDDRIYIAWADYAAKEQVLAPGFRPGARLPSAQASIPTVTNTRWHDTWILSFRLY